LHSDGGSALRFRLVAVHGENEAGNEGR